MNELAPAPRPATAAGSAAPTTAATMTGFGNEHATEALPGALPEGRNSPQRPAYGLYAEQISGTAFTAPRAQNRRTWFYRIAPSVLAQGDWRRIDLPLWLTAPAADGTFPHAQCRWSPQPVPEAPADFLDGMASYVWNGDMGAGAGLAVHLYRANASMERRYFRNADAEMVLLPETGNVRLRTECGVLDLTPGDFAVIPRGIKIAVDLPDGPSRGYLCENYGAPFELPDLGPIGANGLANPRDFHYPQAAYEDRAGAFELVQKAGGAFHACALSHSPLDVVAWHGTHAPYKYDLRDFNVLGSISFDHPDPSIFTVLTSRSDTPGVANADLVVFAPRWLVGQDTFRPPWYHLNTMSEFMGLLYGVYDARPKGFLPGGASLHNCMIPHGPSPESFEAASAHDLSPQHIDSGISFMFESSHPYRVTDHAMTGGALQTDYPADWRGLKRQFTG
ncbi:MAG: homogentisate 1,2-dioxygenase [Rhodospirillaceae bacterium]|nr:homogentisate 1,2-dioxygenase [Rhodospirillaceae bacterium]